MVCAIKNCKICRSDLTFMSETTNNPKDEPYGRRWALMQQCPVPVVGRSTNSLCIFGGSQNSLLTTICADCVWIYEIEQQKWECFPLIDEAIANEKGDKDDNETTADNFNQFWTDSLQACASVPISGQQNLFSSSTSSSSSTLTTNFNYNTPMFFLSKFDFDKDEEDVKGRNHFYFIYIKRDESNGLSNFKFSIENIKFEDGDGSLVDCYLYSAQPKVLVSSDFRSIYFLTTMEPYSLKEKCQSFFNGPVIFIYELRKQDDCAKNWKWLCLTKYSTEKQNRGIICNELIDQETFDYMELYLGCSYLQAFLFDRFIWIFPYNKNWAPSNDPREMEYRLIICFNLEERNFRTINLLPDPDHGFPKQRKRHQMILHFNKKLLYLLPGLEVNHDLSNDIIDYDKFCATIWCFDLETFVWSKLSEWEMNIPRLDYSALYLESDTLCIFGGKQIEIGERFIEDEHSEPNMIFLNSFEFFNLK